MTTSNAATTVTAGVSVAAVIATAATVASVAGKLSAPAAGGATTTARISAPTFLNRCTFGATDTSILAYQQQGATGWFNAQLQAAPTAGGAPGFWTTSANFHLQWVTRRQADFDAAYAAALAAAPTVKVTKQLVSYAQFEESFWARAVLGDDQLRHRMALALSQIFVVSFKSSSITARIAASWFDMLSQKGLGSYIDLLKAVTLHPAMGLYLNIIGNQQADTDPSRHPDENYAREVMQLMSIGLVRLNPDGSTKLDTTGAVVPTYTHDDIAGLANVFTGWSWYAATPTASTFSRQPAVGVDQTSPDVQPLIAYPAYHSQLSKTFLGTTIAAYTGPKPTTAAGAAALATYQARSLDSALRVIAYHPNVAPFIARRLIQQFVTSNPSAAYVGRVAAVFSATGNPAGYGDLFATLTAVLTDAEAQSTATALGNTFGKLREPVIRMTHWLRACEATSKPTASAPTGNFLQSVDYGDAGQLDEAPLEALSVFNFWAPDYVPPGTNIAKAGLVAPEFQAVDSVTIPSYANLMIAAAQNKAWPGGDVTVTYSKEIAALSPPGVTTGDNNQALIDRINFLFFGGVMSPVLSARLTRVLAATQSSAKTPTAAQKAAVQMDKVRAAFIITLTSPEYIVQR